MGQMPKHSKINAAYLKDAIELSQKSFKNAARTLIWSWVWRPYICTQMPRIWKSVPKGLWIQQNEVRLMDTPNAAEACAKSAENYTLAECNICNALIKHYVQEEPDKALEETDKTIWEEL